jgi:hypothetical protein
MTSMKDDTISRQAAIDALENTKEVANDERREDG